MFALQIIIPFITVVALFAAGHFLLKPEGSGIYLPEVVILEEPAETDVTEDIDIDPETGQILPDKYNYLKIENIFTGKFPSSEKLFSIEIALLTKQSTIASDLFIAKMYEIEPDLVAEVTTKILEVSEEQLTNAQGRSKLTDDIREHLNEYLESQGEFPGITEVFIINLNIERPENFVTNGRVTFSFECSFYDDRTSLEEKKTFTIEQIRTQELPFREMSKA